MAEESRMMKRLKAQEECDPVVDRLSSLPDSLLCHIMSFLPTKTSVTTMSLVSRRYLHLWKDLQVLYFDFHHTIPFQTVSSLVNSVLVLRKSRNIQNFHLTFAFDCLQRGCVLEKLQSKNAEAWILAAIGPHLQQLYLYIVNAAAVVVLPPSLLTNCSNLLYLSLVGSYSIEVKQSSVHFPLLKVLSLAAEIVSLKEIVYLLFGSPKLEVLRVYFYFISEELVPKALIPPSSSSESSKSANDNFTWTYFKIVNTNNECIRLGIIGNFHSMGEAFLDVFSLTESEFVDPILNLIRDDDRTEFYKNLPADCYDVYLRLRHSTSKWRPHARVLNYPEFSRLHHLKFILPCFDSNLLVHVLEQCHMLQVLIIQSNKEEPLPLRTWQLESTTVFECLKSHLTYVHIEGYQGLEDEFTFAEYILRNGLLLKTMLIFVDSSIDKTDMDCSLKRLTNISKGSVACQLKFDVDGSH